MEINKEEVGQRFKRSMLSYDANARVQKLVVERLETMITSVAGVRDGKILEIGCGTGLLTRRLKRDFPEAGLYLNDLVRDLCYHAADGNSVPGECCFPGDVEKIAFPSCFDLIVSASTFQWFTTPGETFRKLAGCLKTGGLMVYSTFGKHNLREIRLTTGGGLDYRCKEEMSELLSPCFEVEEVAEELHVIEFDSPLEVLQHLKRTGVNVSGNPTIWTKGRVDAFINDYNTRFAVNGKVTLTYHPLYFVCRKTES